MTDNHHSGDVPHAEQPSERNSSQIRAAFRAACDEIAAGRCQAQAERDAIAREKQAFHARIQARADAIELERDVAQADRRRRLCALREAFEVARAAGDTARLAALLRRMQAEF
jgi:hypothetical protein